MADEITELSAGNKKLKTYLLINKKNGRNKLEQNLISYGSNEIF